jgi:hypothetical protein
MTIPADPRPSPLGSPVVTPSLGDVPVDGDGSGSSGEPRIAEQGPVASLRRALATVRRTIAIVHRTIRANEGLARHWSHRESAQRRIFEGHVELSRLAAEEQDLTARIGVDDATERRTAQLLETLRERLVARGLPAEAADHWIELWQTSAGRADGVNESDWDDAFDWIMAERRGSLVDPAVVHAPTARSFDA